MKLIFLITASIFILGTTQAQSTLYDDTLIAASYAYAHSKKAHSSNNREHVQEYAYKAHLAYKKVEKLTRKCKCPEVNEKAYLAESSAYQVLRQDTYERSRFYAKKSREIGSQLLIDITECFAK